MAASLHQSEVKSTTAFAPPFLRAPGEAGRLLDEPASSAPCEKPENLAAFATIAANAPLEQALALAKRDELDEIVIALLARRPEAAIAHALAANNHIRINRTVLRTLIERGRDDPRLAQFLLRREDLHLCHLRLFIHADAEQRGHLIAITCRSRLGRLRRGDLCHGFDEGKLARIELAALKRDSEALKRLLAHILSCDLATAGRIVEDKGGEVLALVMVALGLPVENFARLLQFGFPEICKTKSSFRALIGIAGRVPQAAATNIITALIGEPRPLAA